MSGSSNEYYPVILDIGPRYIRAGFAGDALPLVTFRTIGQNDQIISDKLPTYYKVNDASMTSEQYDMVISCLFSSNMVIRKLSDVYSKDFNKFRLPQGILDTNLQANLVDIFINQLLVSPSRAKVIIIDANYSILQKSKISTILLSKIGVRSIIWVPESTLNVLGANNSNGLVVNLRWDSLFINAIMDLRILNHFQEFNKYNGSALHYKLIEKIIELDDEHVNELLERNDLFTVVENFILNAVFVRPINNQESDLRSFQILEGIRIPNRLRYEVIESLFFNDNSLPQFIINIINKAPIDIKSVLLENVIIIGDVSNIPGFKTRLIQEIRKLISVPVVCKVNLGLWASCSLYCSTTLVRQNGLVWKSEEITKETLVDSISEDGIRLTNIPDAFNSLYKNSLL